MAITVEQIHETADKLQAQGIKPTQIAVREMLGGGSFSTIADGLRTWRAEQDTTAQLAEVVLPQEIAERSHTLTAQIWETAQQLANDRLVKEREILEHKQAIMVDEVEQAQAVVKTLESEQAELLTQLDQLNAQLVTLKETLELNNVELSSSEQRATALDQRLQQSQTENAQLIEKINEQAEIIAKHINTITDLKTENATLVTKKQNFIERLEQSEQALKDKQGKSETYLKDIADLSAQFANVQGQNKTLKDQLTKAENMNQQQADKIEKLTADLATAKATQTKTPATKQPKSKTKPAEQDPAQ